MTDSPAVQPKAKPAAAVVTLEQAGVEGVRVQRRRRRHRRLPVLLGAQDRKKYWLYRNATATISRGDCVFLMDERGDRASALLRSVTGLLQPDAGTIRRRGAGLMLTRPGRKWVASLSIRQAIRLLAGLYGMTDQQIDERVVECAEFAEVSDMLGKPTEEIEPAVLRQIAFSVATAAPVRLLGADNMALTGPPDFRPKCVPRLRQLMEQGTALVVIQDDPQLISLLATRALLVKKNRLVELAPSAAADLAEEWAKERRRARRQSRRAMVDDDDDDDII
jgi:ABC-2 type transport system ATP-binding protein